MKRRLLFVAVLLLALVVQAEGKWSGDGWLLERPGAVPILFLSGTPEGRDRGIYEAMQIFSAGFRI